MTQTNHAASKPVSICILGASFRTGNLGVSALAAGSVTAALSAHPGARILFWDYGAEPAFHEHECADGKIGIEMVNVRFSKKVFLKNHIARLLLKAWARSLLPARLRNGHGSEKNEYLKALRDADVVAAISGGDSFSDIYGLGRLVYVALPQITAILLGKPLILLPQTIGPFKSPVSKCIAGYILKRSRKVYSREFGDMSPAGNGRIAFCHDVGFVLEPRIEKERLPAPLSGRDPNVPLVGLNVSGLLYIGGYSKNNMFSLETAYPRMIEQLIDRFVRKHGAQVVLVPHVTGDEESDEAACRKVFDALSPDLQKSVFVLEKTYDHHEIKAVIGMCGFFLGSRMHACIAALSQCVPAVGLAYSRKFEGVFASIGMEELVIDLRKNDNESVIRLVDRAYERRFEFSSVLKRVIPEVKAGVLKLFCETAAGSSFRGSVGFPSIAAKKKES